MSLPQQTRRRNEPVPWYRGAVVSSETVSTPADIRRMVREQLGVKAATYRFTPEEKRALRELVYTYEGTGTRTSENEIIRIALNWLLADYQQHGQESILAQTLEQPTA